MPSARIRRGNRAPRRGRNAPEAAGAGGRGSLHPAPAGGVRAVATSASDRGQRRPSSSSAASAGLGAGEEQRRVAACARRLGDVSVRPGERVRRTLRNEAGIYLTEPYDVIAGLPPGSDPTPYAAAGATWWLMTSPGTRRRSTVRCDPRRPQRRSQAERSFHRTPTAIPPSGSVAGRLTGSTWIRQSGRLPADELSAQPRRTEAPRA